MKVETTAGALSAALKTVKPVVERRASVPILQAVAFDGASLRATNLDIDMSVAFAAIRATGKAAILFHPLSGLVSNIPAAEPVTLEAGSGGARLTFGGGCYDLPAFDPFDLPELELGEARAVGLDGQALKAGIGFFLPFISTEEVRYYLNGVCLDGEHIVATNGHHLGCHPLEADVTDFGKPIIHHQTARLLNRLPAAVRVQVNREGSRIGFFLPGVSIRAKLIDGTYPDWRRVIPEYDGPVIIDADRGALLAAIRRLVSVHLIRSEIMLAIDGGRLAVSTVERSHGTCVGREFVDGAAVRGAGEATVVSFNPSYLLEMLRSFPRDERITIAMNGKGNPALLRGSGKAFTVLMPMRTGDDKIALETLAMWPERREAA